MSGFRLIIILCLSFILSGCATAYNPATGQNELILIPTPMEITIGNMAASKVSQKFKFSKEEANIKRVSEIGKKLAAVSDRKDLAYQFNVIEDESLNAMTIPGGFIYVNSGLLEKATDDELACVIGHEIGHVAARHAAKKLQTQIGYDLLMNLVSRKARLGAIQKAASLSFDLIMLGYSREDELLGDRLGVKYAYRAGFDPYAMITFLKKLEEANDSEIGPVFLRSHPYTAKRIKMLQMQTPAIIEKLDKKTASSPAVTQKKQDQASPTQNTAGLNRALKVLCSECKLIFPGKTNYCPYDGTKL